MAKEKNYYLKLRKK